MRDRPQSWFSFYPADYEHDTSHLTPTARSGYIDLLSAAWTRGGALPDDDEALCRMARLSPAEWAAARDSVRAMFTVRHGKLVQKRLLAELNLAEKRYENRKNQTEKARAAASHKRLQKQDVASVTKSVAESVTAIQPQPQPQKQELEHESREQQGLDLESDLVLVPPPSVDYAGLGSTPPKINPVAQGCENAPAARPARKRAAKPKPESSSRETWEAYAAAFKARYGTDPVRNARVNSQLASLVARVGERDAPAVAAFYVGQSTRWYVQKMHSVGVLLGDAEKVCAEWRRGRGITETESRQADRTAALGHTFGELIGQVRVVNDAG